MKWERGGGIGVLLHLFILFTFLSVFPGFSQQLHFTEVTESMKAWGWRETNESGVKVSCYGHGVAFADVNGDSIVDIYISSAVRQANGKVPETLYIGQPGGAAYSEEDGKRGCSDSYGMTGTHGIVFFDYDNDGDFDIYNATTDDRNRLYRNNGKGFFTDVSDSANLKAIKVAIDTYGEIGYGTRGVVAFDANNDGYMDLLGVNWGPVENKKEVPWITPAQPNEFYLNNGNGTFTKDDTRGLTLPYNPSNIGTQGVTAVDINNDGWMDVYICHRNYAYLGKDDSGNDLFGPGPKPAPNQMMVNDGTGHFLDETTKRGLYDPDNDTNGVTFADYDNDGDLDCFVVPKDISVRYLKVYRNDNGIFTDVSSQIRIQQWGFSCVLEDFNNDGFLDIYASRSYGTGMILLGDGKGSFVVQPNAGVEIQAYDPRGAACADIDNDGDLDIYYVDANKDIVSKYSDRLFRNDLTRGVNHWLNVTGRGPKGDAGGFGTKIWVFDQGYMDDMTHLVGYRQVINAYGYLCQDDPVQHFGLGQRTAVDVKVRLLNGTELKMANVGADRKIFFGRPSTISLLSGNGQSANGGQALAQPLRVKVLNTYGLPARGAKVNFIITEGDGSLGQTQPVYANQQGIAEATYTMGSFTVNQTIVASSPEIPGTQITFTATNNSGPVPSLIAVSGSGQTGPVNRLLPDPVVARVVDVSSNPMSGVPIVLKIVSGAGKVQEADSVVINTNASGEVSAVWRLGTDYATEQKIKAYIKTSPAKIVYFTAMTFGNASQLTWQSPLTFTGTVGKFLPDSLAARVTDSQGHPVMGYGVDFSVSNGGGSVAGGTGVRVLSNAAGVAKCKWQLGTVAGVNNNQLTVRAESLAGSPVTVLASAIADRPYRLVKTAGDGQSVKLQSEFAEKLIVAISDSLGNPISGQTVRFDVVQGSATINNVAGGNFATDASGHANCAVKAGWVPGAVSVRATSSANGAALLNSPQFFSLTILTPPISAENGTLVASTPVAANGHERSSILVTIRDEFHNPMSGITVVLHATGDKNALVQPLAPTNASGQVTGFLSSTRAEWKKIWAESNGLPAVSDSAKVQFVPGLPAGLFRRSGDQQTGIVGRLLPAAVVVAVTDSFDNPVSGILLNAAMQTPDGRSIDLDGAFTDEQGLASFRWPLSAVPGVHFYTVSFVNALSVVFTATAQAMAPASIEIVSGDHQTGLVGQPLAAPLVVCVRDADGKSLPGAAINFALAAGAGIFPGGTTAITGADGTAGVRFQLSSQPGNAFVRASATGLTQTVTFSCSSREPAFAAFEIVSGNHQSARRGEMLAQPLVVRAVDEVGQPVSGVEADFVVTAGGAIQPNELVVSDSQGLAAANWRLGTEGQQIVRVQNPTVTGIQAEFTASLRENIAPIVVCPADTAVKEMQTLYFHVRGSDADGDGLILSAASLPARSNFDPASGLFSWTPDYDQSGFYRIAFTADDGHDGVTEKACHIRVDDVHRPISLLTFSPTDTLVYVSPYQQELFRVELLNPDNDTLKYQWMFNNLSVGTQSSLKLMINPAFPAESVIQVKISSRYSSVVKSWKLDIETGVGEQPAAPDGFALLQNYPNPFNPATHIVYSLPRVAQLRLEIYNQAGQRLRSLFEGSGAPGLHEIQWDGRDESGQTAPSGVYYCRMESEGFSTIKKLLLLK